MATADPVNLASLLDDAKCFALVRQHRWPEGVRLRNDYTGNEISLDQVEHIIS
jgi:hypothetical protein